MLTAEHHLPSCFNHSNYIQNEEEDKREEGTTEARKEGEKDRDQVKTTILQQKCLDYTSICMCMRACLGMGVRSL